MLIFTQGSKIGDGSGVIFGNNKALCPNNVVEWSFTNMQVERAEI